MTDMKQTDGNGNQWHMYWHMLAECNFNCSYCFRENSSSASSKECRVVSAEMATSCFDSTGKLWNIYMTGGEPLLYPGFVDIAKALSRRHRISLSTNLSTSNAYALADAISCHQVSNIDVSLHIQERERTPGMLDELVKKFIYFQDRGFNIRLSYVAWPPFLGRMAEDFASLRDKGIRQIAARVFQGEYEGRRYPRSYTDTERDLIFGLGTGGSDRQILSSRTSFLGRKCIAGHRAFVMDMQGRVRRCHSICDEYGNLFGGTFVPGRFPGRCTARRCSCVYQGMKYAEGKAMAVPSHVIVRTAGFLISINNRLAGLWQ